MDIGNSVKDTIKFSIHVLNINIRRTREWDSICASIKMLLNERVWICMDFSSLSLWI